MRQPFRDNPNVTAFLFAFQEDRASVFGDLMIRYGLEGRQKTANFAPNVQ